MPRKFRVFIHSTLRDFASDREASAWIIREEKILEAIDEGSF